ncbi:MAG: c-type cytochrome [Acidimicrobiia bacterium]|nr:c-type cytochrome [Acidimicrobiia bacterium]
MVVLGFGRAQAQDNPSEAGPEDVPGDVNEMDEAFTGEELFDTSCMSCHGPEGEGTSIAPNIQDVGELGADFMLRTGRMPLAQPGPQAPIKEPAYTDAEIERLVEYVGSLGDGPPIPDVDTDDADLVRGGELYRANCQPCHNASGIGGALSYGAHAPALTSVEPTQVVEAMRFGPGQMPVFGDDIFDEQEANDIAAYVEYLHSPEDPGGFGLGHLGPHGRGLRVVCSSGSWCCCGSSDGSRRSTGRTGGSGAMTGQTSERTPRLRGERTPVVAFSVAIVAGLLLAVAYWGDLSAQWQGAFLALCLGGIGVGLVSWAKAFMPAGPETEPRGRLGSTEDEIEAFTDDFAVGERELERRGLLTKMLAGAVGALGIGALYPLFSLGPDPNTAFQTSPFKPREGRRGTTIVDEDNQPIRRRDDGAPEQPQPGGIITVFPEGELDEEFAQTLLINLPADFRFDARRGRDGWTIENPDGSMLVAFSKVCTHAGCPVGLFEEERGLLLCPCHQSTFDVHEACRPVFGPAAVSLPQLPLAWADDGTLIATGDFSATPGPGFWNQQNLWESNH